MIPQRVELKGFLCYKDEQEIRFDGAATLWMLSGLNGSGKSSIFDAVTYALFGHHRGGGLHAHELINKDSDSLVVVFDFVLDGKPYRAKRTLRRNPRGGATGTQQLYRREGGANGDGKWVAIEGTGQKRQFDDWVAEHVGLTYETFTSSVLLLQGKAEKLLDSRPEGRREVLAGIVDLERYERLHRTADEKRKQMEGDLKNLRSRLEALPVVTPLELAAAAERIRTADEAREQARQEVELLLGLDARAKEWVEHQQRLAEARRRWEHAEKMLGDAASIEKDVQRLNDLRDVLPRLQVIAEQRNEIHKGDEKIKELGRHRASQAEELTRRDHALNQARDKKTSTQGLIATDEARLRNTSAQFRICSVQMEKLREYEGRLGELDRLRDEKKHLPDDPAAGVARARERFDALTALAQTVPLLAALAARREDLRQAQARGEAARRAREAVEERGRQAKALLDTLRPRLDEAAEKLRQAAEQMTESRTVLRQARDHLKELTQLDGSKVCRHCGQPLTESHLQDEKRRRTTAVSAADDQAREATKIHQAAQTLEREARQEWDAAEKAVQDLRVEYTTQKKDEEQAGADMARLRQECGQVYGDLPETHRAKMVSVLVFAASAAKTRTDTIFVPPADWLATTYPTPAELSALRGEAAGVAAARQLLQQAEQVRDQWQTLLTQEAAKLQDIARLQRDLPADREMVRREHGKLEAEEKALEKSLTAKRLELREVEAELERLTKEREQVQSAVTKLDAELKQHEFVRSEAQKAMTRTRSSLPASWRTAAETVGTSELFAWTGEKQRLEEAGTDERGRELETARLNRDVLRRNQEELEAQAEAFPAEARQEPAALAARLTEARAKDRACEDELRKAHSLKDKLDHDREERHKVEEECREKEGDATLQKTLADLLGKERLQLYLVRQAERQVVEHANAVLDRLSGGQLYLKLTGEADGDGASAKALELEAYNRQTGEKPINVAFLSGSQKFRVAVSLALGIGQYASRQHRPIESVIIDEGFGCLDRYGRQVMIQELQNLRSQMRCILLVSHQEEFADAFSDGYHFELEEGATRVKRFQK